MCVQSLGAPQNYIYHKWSKTKKINGRKETKQNTNKKQKEQKHVSFLL